MKVRDLREVIYDFELNYFESEEEPREKLMSALWEFTDKYGVTEGWNHFLEFCDREIYLIRPSRDVPWDSLDVYLM